MRLFILGILMMFGGALHCQSLDSLIAHNQRQPNNPSTLNQISWAFTHSYLDSSLYYANQAIQQSMEQNDTTNLAYGHYISGVAMEKKGHFKESMRHFKKTLTLSEQAKLFERQAYTLNSIGILYDQLGKPDSSLYFYEQSLDAMSHFDSNGANASVISNIGGLYEASGNYAQALTKYFESLRIWEEYNRPLKIYHVLSAIASIYQQQDQFIQAREYYFKALDQLDMDENKLSVEITYSNLAELYLSLPHLDSASLYLNKAIKLAKELNDEEGVAFSKLTRSKLLQEQGLLNQAYDTVSSAHDTYVEINYPEMELVAKVQQVRILKDLQDYDKAIKLALSTLTAYRQLKSKKYFQELHEILAQLYEETNQYQLALTHERLQRIYKDSLYNVRLAGEIADLRAKYVTEKQLRQINQLSTESELQNLHLETSKLQIRWLITALAAFAILLLLIGRLYFTRKKAINELEIKNDIIEDALQERELLLKEIHHRVKNNLQIVSSLLNIQSENNLDADEIIKISQDRIYAMAIIHEQLYQSDELHHLDVCIYLTALIQQFKTSYAGSPKKPVFTYSSDPINLSLDKLIPLGLVINEAVTNSVKHAFVENSENRINIQISQIDDMVKLTIADNGKGINFDDASASLGIRLITGLAHQLDGKIKVIGNTGTVIQIDFPIH